MQSHLDKVYNEIVARQRVREAAEFAQRKAKAQEEEARAESIRIPKYKAMEANYPRDQEQTIIKQIQQKRLFRHMTPPKERFKILFSQAPLDFHRVVHAIADYKRDNVPISPTTRNVLKSHGFQLPSDELMEEKYPFIFGHPKVGQLCVCAGGTSFFYDEVTEPRPACGISHPHLYPWIFSGWPSVFASVNNHPLYGKYYKKEAVNSNRGDNWAAWKRERIFVNHPFSPTCPLPIMVAKGDVRAVRELLTQPDVDVNLHKPLLRAIEDGSIEVVNLLLAHPNIDVSAGAAFKSQNIFLNCAIKLNRWETARKLLSFRTIGVNYLIKDLQKTPLEAVIDNGNIDIMRELLARPDIDVNFHKPLFKAIKKGLPGIVELLLIHPNINLNIRVKPVTPNLFLNCAIQSKAWMIVQQFLAINTININYVVEGLDESPLEVMIEHGDIAVVQQLLAREDVDINLNRPLLKAIKTGSIEMVNLFLEHPSIDLDIRVELDTPNIFLNRAIQSNKWDIVKILLAIDTININYVIQDLDKSPLEAIVEHGDIVVVQQLLVRADVDVNFNRSFLKAIKTGSIEMVNLFLEHLNIELNVRAAGGTNNIFVNCAIKYGKWDIAKRLLFLERIAGLEINCIPEGIQMSPLECLIEQDDIASIRLLLARYNVDVNFNQLLLRAIKKGSMEIIMLLLDRPGFDINVGDTGAPNPFLDCAIKLNKWNIVKKLLAKENIHINYVIEELNLSPLEVVFNKGELALAKKLLMRSNIDVNFNCPLLKAASEGQSDVIKILLEHPKINVNVCEELNGPTPLWIAAKHGFLEIVQELLLHPKIYIDYQCSQSSTKEQQYCKTTGRNKVNAEEIATIFGRTAIANLICGHRAASANLYNVALNIKNFNEQETRELLLDLEQSLLLYPELDVNDLRNPATQNHLLMQIINLKRWDLVEKILALATFNVNYTIEELKSSPLEFMIEKGDVVAVQQLLTRKDLDVNLHNPLFKAASEGQLDILTLLLQRADLDINATYYDLNGPTPLWIAAKYGFHEIVKKLLSHPKICVDYQCGKVSKEELKHIETGAQRSKMSAHEIAKHYKHDDVVAVIVEYKKLLVSKIITRKAQFSRSGYYFGPNLIPTDDHLLEELEQLLLVYPDLNITSITNIETQKDTLTYLVNLKRWDLVKKLLSLESFMDVNAEILDLNMSPLEFMVEQGDVFATSKLLNRPNIDVNLNYPLLKAVIEGQTEIVILLLSHPDIEVNANLELGGPNPLWIAAKYGFSEIVKELLLHPDICIDYKCEKLLPKELDTLKDTGRRKMSAQEVALCYKHQDIIKIIEEHKRLLELRRTNPQGADLAVDDDLTVEEQTVSPTMLFSLANSSLNRNMHVAEAEEQLPRTRVSDIDDEDFYDIGSLPRVRLQP